MSSRSDPKHRTRQGQIILLTCQGLLSSILASALLIVLAVATLLATGDQTRQLRSFLYVSSNYESLVTSVNLSDIAARDNSQPNKTYDADDLDGDDAFHDFGRAVLDADDDQVLKKLTSHIGTNGARDNTTELAAVSPACKPHFNLALPNSQWNNSTKFRRIYFYHARKAGGSSMHKYLAKVSDYYGIELKAVEWAGMEEPGKNHDDGATFYVTHLREPVSR